MRVPFAKWRGDGVPNKTIKGMVAHKGVVIHIQQGSEAGTDSWFHNSAAQVSSHFGIAKDGSIDQWVDTDDKAWAEVAGNPLYMSIEFEGMSGEKLTDQQLASAAKLIAFLEGTYKFPAQLLDVFGGSGIGYHSQFPEMNPNQHACPGAPIVAQLDDLLNRVRTIVDAPIQAKPWPVPVPPAPPKTPSWYHRMLKLEDPMLTGDDVKRVQLAVQAGADGVFGPKTQAAVENFQRAKKLVADGIVGPLTAEAIGEQALPPPAWYHHLLYEAIPMIEGDDVKIVQQKVGALTDGKFGPVTAGLVKGFQKAHGLSVDGIVGPETARVLGA